MLLILHFLWNRPVLSRSAREVERIEERSKEVILMISFLRLSRPNALSRTVVFLHHITVIPQTKGALRTNICVTLEIQPLRLGTLSRIQVVFLHRHRQSEAITPTKIVDPRQEGVTGI